MNDGGIEIQGDERGKIAQILSEAGFRPVFAGGGDVQVLLISHRSSRNHEAPAATLTLVLGHSLKV